LGFILADAKWYLAEIVLEITIDDDPRSVVHTNTVLVRADSPEEAYDKSLALGKQSETSYENPDGKRVQFLFKGLHDLNVIHDELEHGAELSFHEQVQMSEEEFSRWTVPKEQLGVFAPIRSSAGPDYAAGDIIREVYERFPQLRRPGRG
jgi:hypothetical protein